MKRLSILVLAILSLMAVPALAVDYDLIADGGSVDTEFKVGVVQVTNDATNLYVKFLMDPGYVLLEAHLDVQTSEGAIPQKNGNPIPGKFAYSMIPGYASEYSETISLNGWIPGTDLVIAAHAKVAKQILYGLSLGVDEGDIIYEIDVAAKTATYVYDTLLNQSNQDYPNGLAYDEVNDKLYYATAGTSHLYEYDFVNPQVDLGILTGTAASGSFYNGKYYYVVNGSDNLRAVTPSPFANTLAKGDFDAASFGFGDIAIDSNGLLYGSATGTGQFFKVEIENAFAYSLISTGTPTSGKAGNLQLAFGKDGRLYGHWVSSEEFYVVNTANGAVTAIGKVYVDGDDTTDPLTFTDLAAGRLVDGSEESAWADGTDFSGKNWATYFEYTVQAP